MSVKFRLLFVAGWVVSTGFAQSSTTINLSGLVAGGSQQALAVYPSDASATKRYPLICFAHGEGVDPSIYKSKLLNTIAARGYIVLAPKSCTSGSWCENFYKDQGQVIKWAFLNRKTSSEVAIKAIDWSYKTGVMGHSMGGMATMYSSTSSRAAYNTIGAAVVFNPFWDGLGDPGAAMSVPGLYIAGASDTTSKAWWIKAFYERAPKSLSKVFAELQSGTHNSIWEDKNFDTYAAAFFDWHLRDKVSGKCVIYASSKCGGYAPICDNTYFPMKACTYSEGSHNDTLVMSV